MTAVLVSAFILGLTSNLHCIGMCGPIALSVPIDRTNQLSKWLGILQYNIGRIGVYGLLGLITGFIGLSITTLGVLQWASIITGLLTILYAWRKYTARWISSSAISGIFIPTNAISVVSKKTGVWKLVLLGALNGLLPCGMVYLGLINSLLSPGPLEGMLAMIFFGAGTLPMMISIVFMANSITHSLKRKFSFVIPYILTILGLMMIVRGSNLGIPYLSPSVEKKEVIHVQNTSVNAEINCCSKPQDMVEKNQSIE